QSMLAVFRNNPEDVVEFTSNAKPGDFGGFAPKVFEHAEKGDSVANWILDRVVADVEASLGALDLADDAPLCLLGGLAPLYAPRLSARYRALLKPPLDDALGGAVQIAVRLFAGHAEATR
ncbi:N-acetylglucosamine kinase, partial [Mesorhizobium sp. M7A.F.Ca.US.006.01.2.1]